MSRDANSNEPLDESSLSPSEQRAAVRERYANAAAGRPDERCRGDEPPTRKESSCCGGSRADSCCADGARESRSRALGYSREELESVAEGANLGLGCGNPNAISEQANGETVVDLGSGGGFDCFLAAREVGEDGSVIGIDMTPEMIERARANVDKNEVDNVEFRLGEIENLPVADGSVDVVISNCVINLSPDKPRVFEEAYRVLRPGGRLAIADVVKTADVPVAFDADSLTGCIAGAATTDELREIVEGAGFESVTVRPKDDSETFVREWSDERPLEAYFASAVVEAEKPRSKESADTGPK